MSDSFVTLRTVDRQALLSKIVKPVSISLPNNLAILFISLFADANFSQ